MKKLEKNENVKINTNLYLEVETGKTFEDETFEENAEALVYNLGLFVANESGCYEKAEQVDVESFLLLDFDNLGDFDKAVNCKTVADLQKFYDEVLDVDTFTAQYAAMQTFMLLMPYSNNRGIWYGLGEDLEKAYNTALEEAFMSEDEL